MPYIQSPTGTYHHRPKGGRRTKCGIRITEDWTAKDSKPNPLTHTCDRCKETSDRVEGLRRFDSRGERKAQKIREMKQ